MNDEKVIKLQHFFAVDLQIKKEIMNIAPPIDYLDERSLEKYSRKVDESLEYMFSEFKCVAADLFGTNSNVFNRILYLEKVIKENFYSCDNDRDKIKVFYKRYITSMDLSFIDKVKEKCVGYTFNNTNAVEKACTINEMLHFIHSYVVNSDMILTSIPLISKKTNNYDYQISYRGVSSPLFDQVFNDFPNDLDCGWTEIVGITDKKMLMMVRDRGHALTIETTLSNDNKAIIKYFVPKLCNIDMINALPGLSNKVDRNSIGASGTIDVPQEELPETLFNFISMVPTDNDMVRDSSIGM